MAMRGARLVRGRELVTFPDVNAEPVFAFLLLLVFGLSSTVGSRLP
jgi:hypothetical protein